MLIRASHRAVAIRQRNSNAFSSPPPPAVVAAMVISAAVLLATGLPAAAVSPNPEEIAATSHPSETTAAPAPSAEAAPAPSAEAGEGTQYVVQFAPGTDVESEAKSIRSRNIGVGRTFSNALRGAVIRANPAQVAALARSPRVLSVEADTRVSIDEIQQPSPWGLDRTDQRTLPLSNSFSYNSAGSGVSLYVIDTGVQASHADFGGRVTAGWTAINDGLNSGDCNGHGTHIAGTAAGKTFGTAKAATIVPVRALHCDGSGYSSDVIAGLDWIVGHHKSGSPAIVNLSIGGFTNYSMDAAVMGVINDGVTAVAAAGNSAMNACERSPGRIPAALTVAASDSSDRQASFSNFGSCVDLYAPGVGITSAWHTSATATKSLSGTSMSVPHVAGAAAVLLSASPGLSPAEVSEKIIANSTAGAIAAAGSGTPNRLLYSDPAISGPATGAFPSNRAVIASSATNPTLYFVSASTKYPISDWGTYLQLSTFAGEYQTSKQADLDNVATGRPATRFVRSEYGSIYLLDSGRRHPVASCQQMQDFGGGFCEAWLPAPAEQLASVSDAGILSNLVTTNAGQTYYISGGVKRELYDTASGVQAGISGSPSSLNVETVQSIPYGPPIIRNDVRVAARFSADQFVYTDGKRTLVIPEFANQNAWFTSLPARVMDNDSLALLPGQSAFAGLATMPTGDTTAIAETSKYVYTSRSVWPTGQPKFSQALLDSIPTKAVITTTPFIKSARSSLISGMVAGIRRAVPDWSTLAELGGAGPNGIQTLEYATAEGPAAGAALHTPGTLVVAPDSASVYYIADEFDALPLESFAVSDQIHARQLVFVSTASVTRYNRSKPPITPVLLCGGTKYLGLGNGSFRLLASTSNSQTLPATTLSPGRCGAMNLGAGQTPSSRPVFVKSPYEATVWWMDGGTKTAISSWSELTALNGGDSNPTIAVFGATAITRVPTR